MLYGTVFVFDTFRSWHWSAGNKRVSCVAKRGSTLWSVVSHYTFAASTAWVFINAKVDTIFVATGLVFWAFWVDSASDDFTGHIGISFIAWYTFARGFVVGSKAFGISSAIIRYKADRNTVSIYAHFSISTFRVTLTSNRFTGNGGVTNCSWRTYTERSMGFNEALGSRSTVAWVYTSAVNTSFSFWTVITASTSWWIWYLQRFTTGVSIRNPANST
jgi:hypothetical protein